MVFVGQSPLFKASDSVIPFFAFCFQTSRTTSSADFYGPGDKTKGRNYCSSFFRDLAEFFLDSESNRIIYVKRSRNGIIFNLN